MATKDIGFESQFSDISFSRISEPKIGFDILKIIYAYI